MPFNSLNAASTARSRDGCPSGYSVMTPRACANALRKWTRSLMSPRPPGLSNLGIGSRAAAVRTAAARGSPPESSERTNRGQQRGTLRRQLLPSEKGRPPSAICSSASSASVCRKGKSRDGGQPDVLVGPGRCLRQLDVARPSRSGGQSSRIAVSPTRTMRGSMSSRAA